MRVYAIGDIHGQLDLLRHAHELIDRDGGADATVVHIGDLVDRGPDSRGVIDFLMQGQAEGRDWHVVKGNHDRMMVEFLDDAAHIDPGLSSGASWALHEGVGAATTLTSYGVRRPVGRPLAEIHAEAVAAVPMAHRQWLAALPIYHLHPLGLFVHAGIRPGVDLQDQTEDDLIWIRRPFLDSRADHGVLVVHGHTPVKIATHYGNHLNIDSGAAYGGPLTAVVIEPDAVHVLTDEGRVPVHRAED